MWCEVEVEDYETYERPESQGGTWILAQQMKVVRQLSFEEVEDICSKVSEQRMLEKVS